MGGDFTRCAIPPLNPLRNARFRGSRGTNLNHGENPDINATRYPELQQGVPSYPAESIPASRQRTPARKLIGNSPKAERKLDESWTNAGRYRVCQATVPGRASIQRSLGTLVRRSTQLTYLVGATLSNLFPGKLRPWLTFLAFALRPMTEEPICSRRTSVT